MRKLLLTTAALLTLLVSPAKAHLIPFDNGSGCVTALHCAQYVDNGGQGFGAVPRVLTLETQGNSGSQVGDVTPSATGPQVTGDAQPGNDKASTPTVGSLGWLGGSGVAIGYNLNQNANGGGPLLTDLVLTIYNPTTFGAVVSFHLLNPTTYTAADFDLQPGNGNGTFGFVLDGAERLIYTSLVINGLITGSSLVGLGADMGCADKQAICAANDGADSFIALGVGTPIINPTCPDCVPFAVPGPVVGAGPIGMVAAGLFFLNFWRRRRNGGGTLPA